MQGLIFSVVAGALMSIQGIFNTRVSDKIGLWETTAIVQGSAFVITILIALFFGNGNIKAIGEVNKLYLLGGAIGVAITFTVMKGMGALGATYAVAAILIAQLLVAALIDAFGLFGTEQVKFGLTKILGILVMIGGVVLFKWKA